MTRSPVESEPAFRRNRFAHTLDFQTLLLRCFRDDILPPRRDRPRTFRDDEVFANLYQHERNPPPGLEVPAGDEYFHEKVLDRLFWNDITDKRLCVLGYVGCGKSTLIDYYLRCYCPHRSGKPHEFAGKMILFFDARTLRDEASWAMQFANICREEIERQCAERKLDIAGMVRARGATKDVRDWVHAALEALSDHSRRPDAVIKYIVIVLDNLDQAPLDTQEKLLSQVERWHQSTKLNLWRIIIPLWPRTFDRYTSNEYNLLRGAQTLRIGTLSDSTLIQKRVGGLVAEAAKIALEGELASRRTEWGRYLADMIPLVENRIGLKIRDLTNGDLRTELHLLEGVLSSEGAYSVWNMAQSQPQRHFEYDLVDALVTGEHECHRASSSRVLNLFRIGSRNTTERHLLAGHHALHFLLTCHGDRYAWDDAMAALGYAEAERAQALEQLRRFNFYHQTPSGEDGSGYGLEVHQKVALAYRWLLTHPAYLDNMALVTPVDLPVLKTMSKTTAVGSQFQSRVRTTLSFLAFVDQNETRLAEQLAALPAEGRARVSAAQVPRLARRAAKVYGDRLAGLSAQAVFAHLPGEWWEQTLAECDAFLKHPEYLTV